MMHAPLRSVISVGDVEETSLALPSANQFGTGRQRVLDQVQTIKRAKSRSTIRSSTGSTSPTSPLVSPVYTKSMKSLPDTLNGSYSSSAFTFANGASKKGAKTRWNSISSSHRERHFLPVRANTSRSEPEMGQHPRVKRSVPPAPQRQFNRSSVQQTHGHSEYLSTRKSQVVVDGPDWIKGNRQVVASRRDVGSALNKRSVADMTISGSKSKSDASDVQTSELTMKQAVEFLSREDENYQHCGASFIQHSTYMKDQAKQEVLKLNGIPALVSLLRSPSEQVQQTASAALRTLAFKDIKNKEEIQSCGGITETLTLLKKTHSSETQKHLTGLLWNLSSEDNLKPELVGSALPVFMETVVLPFAGGADPPGAMDPDVFYHTTGCLRNLSCARPKQRQALRNCRGLIDSLLSYVQNCVAAGRPDDKSVENCVCVFHNLTFQLEAEAPALFSMITALARVPCRADSQGDTSPISCFSQQSRKLEQENPFDYPVSENQHPTGAGWLLHSKTLQTYLSLLGTSQSDDTLEASCGALQNLTSNSGIVSHVMSQIIVQKLNGLPAIAPLLRSPKPNIQKSAMTLVGNLTKNQRLQTSIARQALPELAGILSSGTKEGTESDDTLGIACQTAQSLILREPELAKQHLTKPLVSSLNDLSGNKYFPKSSKAAALLLNNLWSDKEIQSFLKKQGMSKTSFVNDFTTAASKSVQLSQ